MPGTIKRVIAKTELSQNAIDLIEDGYDRFRFEPWPKNKKFVDLHAWKHNARPDKAKQHPVAAEEMAEGEEE